METRPRKLILSAMAWGNFYLWAILLISAILHAVCYPVFDVYLNSVRNIKYDFLDYAILLGVAFAETALIQLVLFLPALVKRVSKSEKCMEE